MIRNNCSRRRFLKTFAALSAAPMLAGMLSGCGGESKNDQQMMVLYGPSPYAGVTVNEMTFLDAQSRQSHLSGTQTVPINASFVIHFNTLMNVASVAEAIAFIDSNNNPVPFEASSDQSAEFSMYVTIVPTANLLLNTNYTLSVGNTATDSSGNKLIINANASASFKTSA